MFLHIFDKFMPTENIYFEFIYYYYYFFYLGRSLTKKEVSDNMLGLHPVELCSITTFNASNFNFQMGQKQPYPLRRHDLELYWKITSKVQPKLSIPGKIILLKLQRAKLLSSPFAHLPYRLTGLGRNNIGFFGEIGRFPSYSTCTMYIMHKMTFMTIFVLL